MSLLVARIVIFAVDLDKLAGFYRDTLGLPQVGGSLSSGSIEFQSANVTITLRAGGRPTDDRSAIKVVFGTPDVPALRATMNLAGANIAQTQGNGPIQSAEGTDPEGNQILLTTDAPRRSPTPHRPRPQHRRGFQRHRPPILGGNRRMSQSIAKC